MSDEKPKAKPKVVSITAPKPLEVNAECVTMIGEVLAMASTGDVVEAVIVYVGPDGSCTHVRTPLSDVNPVLGEIWQAGDEISAAAREE